MLNYLVSRGSNEPDSVLSFLTAKFRWGNNLTPHILKYPWHNNYFFSYLLKQLFEVHVRFLDRGYYISRLSLTYCRTTLPDVRWSSIYCMKQRQYKSCLKSNQKKEKFSLLSTMSKHALNELRIGQNTGYSRHKQVKTGGYYTTLHSQGHHMQVRMQSFSSG